MTHKPCSINRAKWLSNNKCQETSDEEQINYKERENIVQQWEEPRLGITWLESSATYSRYRLGKLLSPLSITF